MQQFQIAVRLIEPVGRKLLYFVKSSAVMLNYKSSNIFTIPLPFVVFVFLIIVEFNLDFRWSVFPMFHCNNLS